MTPFTPPSGPAWSQYTISPRHPSTDGAIAAALALLGSSTEEARDAAVNSARTLGRLCRRTDEAARHAEVVDTIAAVYPPARELAAYLEVLGSFLAGLEGYRLSSEVLAALWAAVLAGGPPWDDLVTPLGRIVELHLVEGVDPHARWRLLEDLRPRPIPRALIAPVTRLVCITLPRSLGPEPRIPGSSLGEVLARRGPGYWPTIWARVAGVMAASDDDAL